MWRFGLAAFAAASLSLAACSDEPSPAPIEDVGAEVVEDVADVGGDDTSDVVTRDCDDTHGPVVMVHGFLAAGDTWVRQVQRFSSNGWCEDMFYAFDWNSLDFGADNTDLLDAFIDRVLEESGAEQVTLMGHSAGGNLGYTYLRSAEHAAKVSRYVHVAASARGRGAGPSENPVPTLNLFSPDDLIVTDSGEIEGATNVSLDGADHYAVATSAEAFEAMYSFIAGTRAGTSLIVPEDEVRLSGRVVTLGENQVPVGATVNVYLISEADGSRRRADPVETFQVGEDGRWGPVFALQNAAYEFRVTGPERETVPVSYYRERQARSNDYIYLRTLPPADSVGGAILAALPFEREAAVVAVFSASRGLVAGVDSLTIDGVETLLDTTAAPETNLIALFAFDDNDNEESDLTSASAFSSFPFLSGIDVYLPGDGRSTRFTLNGERSVSVVRRPGSEGATIAVFD